MKQIKTYIDERLQLGKKLSNSNYVEHKYFPETKHDLHEIIFSLIKQHTNKNEVLDLNCIDTSKIIDMSYLFYSDDLIEQDLLKKIKKLDISSWDVSNVKSMFLMFYKFNSLKDIGNLSLWDVSKVENMQGMFNRCTSLKHIDISSWNTHSLKTSGSMFYKCSSLVTTGKLDNLDMSNNRTFDNMFDGCVKLSDIGDISNWNVKNVKNMTNMFLFCDSLYDVGDLEKWKQQLNPYLQCVNMVYHSGLKEVSWNTRQTT